MGGCPKCVAIRALELDQWPMPEHREFRREADRDKPIDAELKLQLWRDAFGTILEKYKFCEEHDPEADDDDDGMMMGPIQLSAVFEWPNDDVAFVVSLIGELEALGCRVKHGMRPQQPDTTTHSITLRAAPTSVLELFAGLAESGASVTVELQETEDRLSRA